MSDIAIRVENLGKRYRIGGAQTRYKTLRESLVSAASAPVRWLKGQRHERNTFWALQDVSFEIKQGEAVGIIGRNGAGKSTLLKILSRITKPTAGRVDLYGRVGSLLEVGTGFSPELTGRDNIYLNGAILGMRRVEIAHKFDEIVDFSEIEKFLDTQVKFYSSGMYMRLAFAVAAHLEPEILVVDEVLAVGDAAFQKKCLGKMGDTAKTGRTVLFVSHNMLAVSTLCHKTALLEKGHVLELGETQTIIDSYLNVNENLPTNSYKVWETADQAPGNDKVRLRRIGLRTEEKDMIFEVTADQVFRIFIEYWLMFPQSALLVDLVVLAADGTPVFESVTSGEPYTNEHSFPKGLFCASCAIPANLLNEGGYRLRYIFYDSSLQMLYEHESTHFSVCDTTKRDFSWYGKFLGHVKPKLEWTTEIIKLEE